MADLFNDSFDATKNREPLHPVVQMRFGAAAGKAVVTSKSFVLTIPPEHLVEFTYTSRRGADGVTVTFIDATFGDIEAELFEADKREEPLLVRWGFPGNGLEEADWHTFEISNIAPTISHAGIRLTITGYAKGAKFAVIAEPTVYTGKISNVVKKIAEEMGYSAKDTFIEETDDEENETRKTPWYSGNRTRLDMLKDLVKQARSKSHPNETYDFRLTSKGQFHFSTDRFIKVVQKSFGSAAPQKKKTTEDKNKKTYRRFQVLFGVPNGVSSFTPRYETSNVGLFSKQCIGSTVDPRTKQFQQQTIDRKTVGSSTDHDPKGARTSHGPLVDASKTKDATALATKQRRKSNSYVHVPTRSVGIGGRCAGKTTQQHTSPDQAITKIENAWKRLHSLIGGGSLELVGLPEHASFTTDEQFCDISVILPRDARTLGGGVNSLAGSSNISNASAAGTNARGGIHWSSGRYRLKEIVHSITTGYVISVELYRPTHLEGKSDAKTGAAKKKAPATVQLPTTAAQAVDLVAPPSKSSTQPVDPNNPLTGVDI